MHEPQGTARARTRLAWQRTALAVLAGAALLTRLTFDELGAAAFTVLVVTVPLATWALWEGSVRHDRELRGGRAAAALALAVALLALAELVSLVRGW